MANYKLVNVDQLDADMTSVADKIRAKGGTTAALEWPAGYEAAVEAISTGVEVQRATGTFTTDSSGAASVNCGFRPDAVYLSTSISGAHSVIFSEGGNGVDALSFSEDENYSFVCVTFTQTSTGFSVECNYCDWSFDWTAVSKKSYSYVALKYTE